MKNLLLLFVLLPSFGAWAQVPSKLEEEKAKQAVRADIEKRASARRMIYQPGEFQTSLYANTEQKADLAGSIVVVHSFQVKDSTDVRRPYQVSYLVTAAGQVYVQEVVTPRR
ncbi:hypothetical protein J0X19_24620 [Hymenobacter sp. BT186]|uniref:DUF4783 domain-containing protein n=1 Tax=Hymenobacter telluris TaxID=2816474 RepID=A0A939JF67_9BACT|nr:hypothetical protein [Hymenobacter telluris]MBO0361165.1 hypothetical protein [Hymenobacter telluris]MBW3377193.1 hypothetical protein [Hymenobacter norwichensis]